MKGTVIRSGGVKMIDYDRDQMCRKCKYRSVCHAASLRLYHLYLYQLKTQVDPLAIKTVDPSYYFIIHCGGTTISIQIFVLKKTQDE
jgi:hypothetical protein